MTDVDVVRIDVGLIGDKAAMALTVNVHWSTSGYSDANLAQPSPDNRHVRSGSQTPTVERYSGHRRLRAEEQTIRLVPPSSMQGDPRLVFPRDQVRTQLAATVIRAQDRSSLSAP